MSIRVWLLIFGSLSFDLMFPLDATYQCGIRKNSFLSLIYNGTKVRDGEWPWHVGLFHKTDGGSPEYACGGTLVNQKHILTAAHCVVNRDTNYALPEASIELHFGQQNLSKITPYVQIRDVSKIHVHPEYSTHQNDIAVLVMRLTVQYTNFVIPICMDQRVDRDLQNLVGRRGWITGWGTTDSGNLSDVLQTASMPIVNYLECLKDDRTLFAHVLNSNVFCAGDRNGTSPGTGDSGGGMYFSDGDGWVLRGIVSFGKADESEQEVDTSKYTVFVNVQWFLTWIKTILDGNNPEVPKVPKRISEQECERFQELATRRRRGHCPNSRHPHTVSLLLDGGLLICTGILVNENYVLTACICTQSGPIEVQIDTYGEIGVSEVTCHPKFRRGNFYHDLAVLKLNSSVHLRSTLIPACLASNWTENLYDTLLQTGFGVYPESYIKKFHESDDNYVLAEEDCQRTSARFVLRIAPNGVAPKLLCVKNSDKTRTHTMGTAGSPLQSFNSQTCMFTVVGVLNGGDEFHSAHDDDRLRDRDFVIDFYSRVAYHLDWIEQIVWNVEPTMMTNVSTRDVKIGSQ